MKLTARLEKIIELTDKCNSIADIGTDHGYIPVELVKRQIIKKAIATDINEKPLKKSIDLARLNGIEDKIDFRLGDGLKPIKVGEVNGVIIAGMGGEAIKSIITTSINIVKDLSFLILQPAQNPEVLRKYLYSGNFTIISEYLIKETDGRFYEYFKVRYNPEILLFSSKDFDFEVSPVLINKKDPLMGEYLISKLKEIELIKSKLDLSFNSSNSKLIELNDKADKISEVIKWL